MSDQKTESSSLALLEEIKDEYIKSFNEWLLNSGINPVIGKLMQLFRTEDRPLTQGEMKHDLDLSKATISRNLKTMEQMNLLKINEILPIQILGDKYNYELIDNSLVYITMSFLRKIYQTFKQRNEDNKRIMEKLKSLAKEQTNDKNIEHLMKIITEEILVFTTLEEKFRVMLKEIETDMLNIEKTIE